MKEVVANHPLLYKQSLDVYGYTVHTEMIKGTRCALSNFAIKGSCSSTQTDNPKGVSASHLDKVGKLLLALETALTLEPGGTLSGLEASPAER